MFYLQSFFLYAFNNFIKSQIPYMASAPVNMIVFRAIGGIMYLQKASLLYILCFIDASCDPTSSTVGGNTGTCSCVSPAWFGHYGVSLIIHSGFIINNLLFRSLVSHS